MRIWNNRGKDVSELCKGTENEPDKYSLELKGDF